MYSFIIVMMSLLMPYVLFQKHALPLSLARYVARLYFFPTLPITIYKYTGRWWHYIDEGVFVGAAPLTLLDHPSQLKSLGVGAVVNLCDEYSGPVKQWKELGVQHLYLPTVDHTEPSLDQLDQAVSFIALHRAQGREVYVHCKGGHGRSAAVGFAWLLFHRGMTPAEAQAHINQRRKVRKGLFKQPNILAYYALLQHRAATCSVASFSSSSSSSSSTFLSPPLFPRRNSQSSSNQATEECGFAA